MQVEDLQSHSLSNYYIFPGPLTILASHPKQVICRPHQDIHQHLFLSISFFVPVTGDRVYHTDVTEMLLRSFLVFSLYVFSSILTVN